MFNSIQEVIEAETSHLSYISPRDYEKLAEAYIARAESYLVSNQFKEAVDDFQKGYDLFTNCGNMEKAYLVFRSFFGMTLAYDQLQLNENALENL